MLVCNISMYPRREPLVVDLVEAASALTADESISAGAVLAALVDDPSSIVEVADAYYGDIMMEAASATEITDVVLAYSVLVDEAASAIAIHTDVTIAVYTVTLDEAVTAVDLPDKAVVTAAFDPGTVIDTALSNSNLTATHTTANANSGARVIPLQSTGKIYFEITLLAGHGSFDAMGLASAGINYNNWVLSGTNSVVVSRGGGITINGGAALANIGAFAPNDVMGIAVDLTAHLVWCRRNAGPWNNNGSANPATAVGGFTCPSVALAPCVCFVGSGTAIGDAYTANFGAPAYANATPSGFGNWPP